MNRIILVILAILFSVPAMAGLSAPPTPCRPPIVAPPAPPECVSFLRPDAASSATSAASEPTVEVVSNIYCEPLESIRSWSFGIVVSSVSPEGKQLPAAIQLIGANDQVEYLAIGTFDLINELMAKLGADILSIQDKKIIGRSAQYELDKLVKGFWVVPYGATRDQGVLFKSEDLAELLPKLGKNERDDYRYQIWKVTSENWIDIIGFTPDNELILCGHREGENPEGSKEKTATIWFGKPGRLKLAQGEYKNDLDEGMTITTPDGVFKRGTRQKEEGKFSWNGKPIRSLYWGLCM